VTPAIDGERQERRADVRGPRPRGSGLSGAPAGGSTPDQPPHAQADRPEVVALERQLTARCWPVRAMRSRWLRWRSPMGWPIADALASARLCCAWPPGAAGRGPAAGRCCVSAPSWPSAEPMTRLGPPGWPPRARPSPRSPPRPSSSWRWLTWRPDAAVEPYGLCADWPRPPRPRHRRHGAHRAAPARGLGARGVGGPRLASCPRAAKRPRAFVVALAREADADALVSLDRDLRDAGLTDIAIDRPAAFLGRLPEPSIEQTPG